MRSPSLPFTDWTDQQLSQIRAAGQWRQTRPFDALGPVGLLAGREVVCFASNDYLGLSAHTRVIAAAHEALDRWGTGATASRLVVGSRPIHTELEDDLSNWKNTERSLVFPSGYAANLGLLSTLGGPDCLIVSDELNHASIIDGCRLSRSEVAVVGHNDPDHVDRVLHASNADRAIVITEAVFSMDGDEAPLADLAECCAHHGALLVIDAAHAVLGPSLDPIAAIPVELVHVVTLSKALGAVGGAVCGPASLVDLLINRARSFIFTTGLSPADTAAARESLRIVRSSEGEALIRHLRQMTDLVRPGHASPIIPIVVGAESAAVDAADALLEQGLLVPAIRPPTVAPGTSRLRVALSAAHTRQMVERLCDALTDVGLHQ